MKPRASQTYYEILEISVDASPEDVAYAAKRLLKLYDEDQVAMYGLVDPASGEQVRERIREARDVLADPESREYYDLTIGLPTQSSVPDIAQSRPPQLQNPSKDTLLKRAPLVPQGTSVAKPDAAPSEPLRLNADTHQVDSHEDRFADLQHETMAESVRLQRPLGAAAPPREESMAKASPPPHAAAPPREESMVETSPAPQWLASAKERSGLSPPAKVSATMPSPPKPPPAREAPPTAAPISEIAPDQEFSGRILRQIRESKGLTIHELSERTRIGSAHLENLEGDRFDLLPATVYLRGFLMCLARELGIDGIRVSKSYLALVDARRLSR